MGWRCQASARSSAAAPQNQAGSRSAWRCSASRSGSPVARMKRPNRVSAAALEAGRQAASGTSRPKVGQFRCVTSASYRRARAVELRPILGA